ncbi:hypothetical protein MPER_05382, partial [Moniliophthora perniciosa FA553]
ILRDSESDDVERNGDSSLEDASEVSVGAQIERERDHDIKYRSCSWQKLTTVLYTSLILWRYCLKHPDIRDVCDIGRKLFGGAEWAYNVTAVFFILNNTFIQALHVLVGARLFNMLSNSSQCTVVFA